MPKFMVKNHRYTTNDGTHLDTRYIDGERTLLFGPFANVGPKFLKHGSNLDLFKSIKPYNITTLLASAVKTYH